MNRFKYPHDSNNILCLFSPCLLKVAPPIWHESIAACKLKLKLFRQLTSIDCDVDVI